MNDEIKEILRKTDIDAVSFGVIINYITNLQTIEQQYSAILSENAELENKITNLQQENQEMKTNTIPTLEHNIDALVDEVDELEDYKSRCEKANNQLKIIMQIIKEQPTRNVEDDEWIENRLIGVVNILQNGNDSQ